MVCNKNAERWLSYHVLLLHIIHIAEIDICNMYIRTIKNHKRTSGKFGDTLEKSQSHFYCCQHIPKLSITFDDAGAIHYLTIYKTNMLSCVPLQLVPLKYFWLSVSGCVRIHVCPVHTTANRQSGIWNSKRKVIFINVCLCLQRLASLASSAYFGRECIFMAF